MSTILRIEYIGAAWCAPCRIVKPAVEAMAHRYGVRADFRDYDEDLDDEARDGVKKLPTIRVWSEDNTLIAEIITRHVETLEAQLAATAAPLRVSADEDF
jgi:thiol-disulfide isomerase/thioredoxin